MNKITVIEIENPMTFEKSKKEIVIHKMGAMEGWEMQRRFVEFAMSKDAYERQKYTMDVLAYAKAVVGEQELPLATAAMIDNHLGSWLNIKIIFEDVLRHNGIDPDTHAEKEHYWAHAGAEMAAAFIAESVRLIGPLLEAQQSK